MHATKVFFAVIGPVKLLVTNEALEGLLFTMNRLVPRVKVPPIGGVRTIRTCVPFVTAADAAPASSAACRRQSSGPDLVLVLHAVLEPQKVLGDAFQNGILPPQGAVRVLLIVLSSKVHPDAAGPGGCVVAARALEDAEVGVRSEPMLRDSGEETDAAAVKASKEFVGSVVGRHFGRVPTEMLFAFDPCRYLRLRFRLH